jgi:cholesterol oxidase
MADSYDVIVVGSGFGGAVAACRLAQKGLKVLILERGRRWAAEEYPRERQDDWLWSQERPHKLNGWMDFRLSMGVCTAQAAGVGGGSILYGNVVIPAKKEVFEYGWPQEISYDELVPYYGKVGEMLRLTELPAGQLTPRFHLMKESAEKIGLGDRFQPVKLAVTFDPEWHYGLDDPYDESHSKTWTNEQGLEQGTCVHCGNCVVGCRVKARNTLDLNYIPTAERNGAEVRPLHMVRFIAVDSPGYRVFFDRLEGGRAVAGSVAAPRVVLAAGSLGSTEILLRCRDQYRTLPGLGSLLGYNWSTNGDFVSFSFHDRAVLPARGPTISAAIDLLDGKFENQQLFIEDGGFPDAFLQFVEQRFRPGFKNFGLYAMTRVLGKVLGTQGGLDRMMLWFGQCVDAPTGRLRLRRKPLKPWRRALSIRWDGVSTERPVGAMIRMQKRLADAAGGEFLIPPSWTTLRKLTTPHPLGGCKMGNQIQDGVVDHRGEVFGYPGLYVADGAIIPKAIGLNPSKTIAALAERIADLMEA